MAAVSKDHRGGGTKIQGSSQADGYRKDNTSVRPGLAPKPAIGSGSKEPSTVQGRGGVTSGSIASQK